MSCDTLTIKTGTDYVSFVREDTFRGYLKLRQRMTLGYENLVYGSLSSKGIYLIFMLFKIIHQKICTLM